MNDDEWLAKMSPKNDGWKYHEICLWLPHKPEAVEDIAHDMVANGFRLDRAIAIYEGKILDGRHRYEAAIKAGVDPIFAEFQGTKEEAIAYVTSENVARRHLSDLEKKEFYIHRAEVLGVRTKADNQHAAIATSSPSQAKHASDLGVDRTTITRWEKDRKNIKSDPELSSAFDKGGLKGVKEAREKRRKATKEEAERIAKLKSLGERSEAESSNVDRKLDKYREQGIDVDAVKSQGQRDSDREAYRKENRKREELTNEIAKILVDNKDYQAVAAILNAAYPRQGELEKAHEIFTTE